ncbi:MAG: hypothetical protein M1379_00245 [Firmicutes bacterium]|nr:hypothetical protein [Bacillota bacterium]
MKRLLWLPFIAILLLALALPVFALQSENKPPPAGAVSVAETYRVLLSTSIMTHFVSVNTFLEIFCVPTGKETLCFL